MNRVIYPGSFDPITKGHMDIINQASLLFDEVVVAILQNPNKKTSFFTIEERLEIIKKLYENYDNITPIRLLGVFTQRLKKEESIIKQYTLFDDFDKIDKENNIQELLSKINNQYDSNIINFGYKNKGVKK